VHQGIRLPSDEGMFFAVALSLGDEERFTRAHTANKTPLWNEVLCIRASSSETTMQVALVEVDGESGMAGDSPRGERKVGETLMTGEFHLPACPKPRSYCTGWVCLRGKDDTQCSGSGSSSPLAKVLVTVASRFEDVRAMEQGLIPVHDEMLLASNRIVTGCSLSR
jgi:hypothetical protein